MRCGAVRVDTPCMTSARLSAVPDAPAGRPAPDPRVRAAAAVLAGEPVADVAERAGVDAAQVERWATALASGGAAAVGGIGLERPADGATAESVPVEDFLSVLAHELRTPLTAARVALRVLAAPDVAPAVRARVGETVLERLAALDRLTLDVADAVAVVTGRARLAPERVELGRVVSAACAAASVEPVPTPPVHVWVDPVRLDAVTATLLGHARRYCAPEDVQVRVQALPDAALVTVRLSGVEVDRETAVALFEPFGSAARGDGNGLAMYVVRALVVASGGTVGMAGTGSSPDGDAATVLWVRLPLHEGAAPLVPRPRTAPVRISHPVSQEDPS